MVELNWQDFFVALGGVLVFKTTALTLKDIFNSYAIISLIVGIILILGAKYINQNISFIDKTLIRILGSVFIFISASSYFDQFILKYFYVAAILGIIMVKFSHQLAGLMPNG